MNITQEGEDQFKMKKESTKGVIEQIENSENSYKGLNELTPKDIENIVRDTFFSSKKSISLGRSCLEQGFVVSTDIDLKLCNNPECKSCREIQKSMIEYGK